MRVNGRMIKDMVEDTNDIQTETYIKDNSKMGRLMVKDITHGFYQVKYTMDNGKKV